MSKSARPLPRQDQSRRQFVHSLGLAIGLGLVGRAHAAEPASASVSMASRSRPPPPAAAAPSVILLGTGGGPVIGATRHMAGNVLVTKGEAYLIDCGYGVAGQLARAHVDLSTLSSVFVTHHHPDHNLELGTVLTISWLYGRRQPVAVYGPPPITQMVADYLRMVSPTTDGWINDVQAPPFPDIHAHDVSVAGAVMENGNLRVAAAVVQHPPIAPAFAYRFECQGRSVVFSGDTAPCEALVELATDADVLVHEAMDAAAIEASIRSDYEREVRAGNPNAEMYRPEPWIAHMRRSHSSAVEVGRMAARARVKTLVLSHFVPGDRRVTDAAWRAAAAKHFHGHIVVGHDLMVVPL